MKIYTYSAMAGIRTFVFPHGITMDKESHTLTDEVIEDEGGITEDV